MHVLPPHKRMLLLTEGRLGVFTSKTAAVLLRYRPDDIVAVVDSDMAGADLRKHVPWAPQVPIVADISSVADLEPDALYIGVAPVGGALPDSMRGHVRAALDAGIDVVSGLHTFLAADEEFVELAADTGARIFDLRRPPTNQVIAAARARQTRCRRILTVGTDCNVGKMVAAVELTRAARQRGLDAQLVATGQTAIMVAGRGIAVDAVVSDFVAGAIEEAVLAAADSDLCIVEGQGSIGHAGYSGVTLALLHGTCPDAMILVHHAGRTHYSAEPRHPLPPLAEVRAVYEQAAGLLHPARVVGVALNTFGATEEVVRQERERIEQELHVPVADPFQDGCARLLDAALET